MRQRWYWLALLISVIFMTDVNAQITYPHAKDNPVSPLVKAREMLIAGEYRSAERLADSLLRDDRYAADAAEIKIYCMRNLAVTPSDSTKYLIALLALHDRAPRNDNYLKLIMEYFSFPGREEQIGQFADDELRKDSTNRLSWAFKGESLIKRNEWKAAIPVFERAVALDSNYTEAHYNLALLRLKEVKELEDSIIKVTPENSLQIALKSVYPSIRRKLVLALSHLGKVAVLDENEQTVRWKKFHKFVSEGLTKLDENYSKE